MSEEKKSKWDQPPSEEPKQETTQPKRKRKWDLDDQGRVAEPENKTANASQPEIYDAAQAAKETAAKINALKGITSSSTSSISPLLEFQEEVEINHVKNKTLLTKASSHEQIAKETGATILTKGRYVADKSELAVGEKPLYLHITAPSKSALDIAVAKIKILIDQSERLAAIYPVSTAPPGVISIAASAAINPAGVTPTTTNTTAAYELPSYIIQEKIYINIEADKTFPLKPRLVGPSGSYIKHIQQTSGVRIALKGRGSGFLDPATGKENDEDLFFYITSPHKEKIEQAKQLCNDLIATVKTEFEKHTSSRQQYPTPKIGTPTPPPVQFGYGQYSEPYGGFTNGSGYPMGMPMGMPPYPPMPMSGYPPVGSYSMTGYPPMGGYLSQPYGMPPMPPSTGDPNQKSINSDAKAAETATPPPVSPYGYPMGSYGYGYYPPPPPAPTTPATTTITTTTAAAAAAAAATTTATTAASATIANPAKSTLKSYNAVPPPPELT